MQILGKFCADVRVQNVMWPRDRRSDFRKLGIKRCVRLEEKSHEKAHRDLRRSRGSHRFCTGGGGGGSNWPPPPVKIGLTVTRMRLECLPLLTKSVPLLLSPVASITPSAGDTMVLEGDAMCLTPAPPRGLNAHFLGRMGCAWGAVVVISWVGSRVEGVCPIPGWGWVVGAWVCMVGASGVNSCVTPVILIICSKHKQQFNIYMYTALHLHIYTYRAYNLHKLATQNHKTLHNK